MAFSRAERLLRSKSAKPSSASSLCICALTAACVKPILLPAAAKVPSRATAIKVFSSRIIQQIPFVYQVKYILILSLLKRS